MKKTLTVNLGGSVFHIDEDAYQLLDKYLSNLRIHFRKEEGSEEIMNDFEMRISELLSERIRLGYEVISIEQVEEVIRRMGKPEELFDEETAGNEEEKERAADGQEIPGGEEKHAKRRLMRDPENRILGGVAGGLAAYMGWDPTAIRIVLILLIFFYGYIIPIYLLLWIIVPPARTATEKLQMRGENVTVENIGKTVTDSFEKVSNNVGNYIRSDKPRNALQKVADAVVLVIGYLLKFIGILAGIILLPIFVLLLFILVVTVIGLFIGLVGGGSTLLYHLSPFAGDFLYSGAPVSLIITGCLALILLAGVPAFAIVYAIGSQLFKWKPLTVQAKWVLVGLWFLAFLLLGIYFYLSAANGWSTLPWLQELWNEPGGIQGHWDSF